MPILENIPPCAELSDLFFNHEHPTHDALWGKAWLAKETPTQEEVFEAILADATEFAESHGGDAKWYADDFVRRL